MRIDRIAMYRVCEPIKHSYATLLPLHADPGLDSVPDFAVL